MKFTSVIMALMATEVASVRLQSVYVPSSGIYIQMLADPAPATAPAKPEVKTAVVPGKRPRRIIDADGDGVEDNKKYSHDELDRFNKPRVFGVAVEDMHNTQNGELPGHHNFGKNHEPGTNPHAEAQAKDAAAAKAATEQKQVAKESTDLQLDFDDGQNWDRAQNEGDNEAVSVMSEVNVKSYYVDHGKSVVKPHKRRIVDADGDGVEDNVDYTHHQLDKFNKPRVFGVAVEDMHNTHNGELPGHHRFGEGHEPGTDPWAEARAKEATAAKAATSEKKKAAESTDIQFEAEEEANNQDDHQMMNIEQDLSWNYGDEE